MDKYEILKKYFGYKTLREGQEELTNNILNGRDVLGIMPTGAGKSLCYQLPALMFQGITLVISPLISLMSDQVKALNQAGIHAAYINSSLSENQVYKALLNAKRGQYKIVYAAPERLETDRFLDFACSSNISMVTVDEAHCVSQWGQDFRPSYVRIANFIDKLPRRPVISAFTATATQKVKEDILCILQLNEPKILITGFDRKNLFFKVEQVKGGNTRLYMILNYVKEHKYELKDITDICKDIIRVIIEQKQRYGRNVVINTVQGKNLSKLKQLGLDKLSTYGIRKNEDIENLLSAMDKLELEGYLVPTNDKYAILKLSASCKDILDGKQRIEVKCMSNYEQKPITLGQRRSDILTGKGLDLFERLRNVRMELARKAAVAPYMVCSDKTLTDMCIKLPFNKKEMLSVNGIGENKYDKYGESFVEAIIKFMGGRKEKLCYQDAKSDDVFWTSKNEQHSSKHDFNLTDEIDLNIVYGGNPTISEFVRQINNLRNSKKMKVLQTTILTTMLREEGYIDLEILGDIKYSVATPKGKAIGITEELRSSERAGNYKVLHYNEKAQKFMVQWLKNNTSYI